MITIQLSLFLFCKEFTMCLSATWYFVNYNGRVLTLLHLINIRMNEQSRYDLFMVLKSTHHFNQPSNTTIQRLHFMIKQTMILFSCSCSHKLYFSTSPTNSHNLCLLPLSYFILVLPSFFFFHLYNKLSNNNKHSILYTCVSSSYQTMFFFTNF